MEESDYHLHYVEQYAWNNAISENQKAAAALNDRSIVDVKVSGHTNALAFFASKKAARPISCELKVRKDFYESKFDEAIDQVLKVAKEKNLSTFAGFAMCPREPPLHDKKVTIFAEYFELEPEK